MTDQRRVKEQPHLTEETVKAAAEREAKLAAALRQNLLKRKAQSRDRTAPEASTPSGKGAA